jgi:argininosuccinate lyase
MFASDVVLFMSPGFGFLTMSDEFTTGSSIMPQKKNPDLFELIRARCNRLQAVPNEITLMTAGLPPGYNRDYQELKAILFDAFDEITEILSVIPAALKSLVVRNDIMKEEKYNVIFAVEEANRMVLKGIPFRDAYKTVSAKLGTESFRATGPADYTHTGSIGNTGGGQISKRLEKLMESFNGAVSPHELVQKILKEADR